MKAKLGLEMRSSPTQEQQLICNCCGQPYYPNKSWEDRMRAIIFGAEKYSVCPLCAQEVQSDVFQDEGYRKRCRREVARLQQMFELATKARRK
jgi:predicted amidophosphoribosyltransferase